MHDNGWQVIPPTFTAAEISAVFAEMTQELFASRPELATSGSLMIHLFPDLAETHTDLSYSDGLPGKPEDHSRFTQLDVQECGSGILSLCRQDFLQFGTFYQWHHFVHSDHMRWGIGIRDRLIASGIRPAHEWWISYMASDAHFQKHVDGISPLLRYSFVVKQPPVLASIQVDQTDLFFPEGTAYVLDGERPHQVLNTSTESRIMLLGSMQPDSAILA